MVKSVAFLPFPAKSRVLTLPTGWVLSMKKEEANYLIYSSKKLDPMQMVLKWRNAGELAYMICTIVVCISFYWPVELLNEIDVVENKQLVELPN